MRIHFASAERPKSVARKLRKLMSARSIPISQSKSLEAVADLYGYRDWQELAASIGKRTASHDDADVAPETAAARRVQQREALERLGFAQGESAAIAESLAPTGRGPARPATPAASVTDALLERAFRGNATDIHLEPAPGGYRVRLRRLGEATFDGSGPAEEYREILLCLKDRSRMDLKGPTAPQDGSFQREYAGDLYEIRTSTIPTKDGESLVARILDPERVGPRLEDMGIETALDWSRALEDPGVYVIASESEAAREAVTQATIRHLERRSAKVLRLTPDETLTGQARGIWKMGSLANRAIARLTRPRREVLAIGEIGSMASAKRIGALGGSGHAVLATIAGGTMEEAVRALREFGSTDAEIRSMRILVADAAEGEFESAPAHH